MGQHEHPRPARTSPVLLNGEPEPPSARDAERAARRTRRRDGVAAVRDAARAFAVNAANPNLRRAQLSFAAAWTGEWMLTVALAVVAFRDGGPAAVGYVAFLRMVPAAVLSPVGTAFADRSRRDRVLRWTCAVRAGALAACALTVGVDGPPLIAYMFAAVATIAFVVYRPAHSALLPSLCLTPLELTSANVVRGLVDSLSTLIGPALAAVLLALADPATALGCAAVLSFAAGLALTGLSYDAPPSARTGASAHLFGQAIDGFRALPRHPDVFLLVRLTLTQAITRGCFSVLVVVVAIEVLGVGESGVGVLTAAIGAGAVIGSLAVSLFADGRRLAADPRRRRRPVGAAARGRRHRPPRGRDRDRARRRRGGEHDGRRRDLHAAATARARRRARAGLRGPGELGGARRRRRVPADPGAARRSSAMRWALVVVGALGPVYAAVAWTRLRAIDRTVTRRDLEIGLLDELPMFRPLAMPAIEQLADRPRRRRSMPGTR